MSKISTYEVAPVPKLADKLIGTSVGGEIEDVTYNFTLQELLDVFLPVIPANNLQGILDYGNTATQDINLFGTITTTYLEVTDTANFLNSYFVGDTHIQGGLFDSEDSIGLAGQVLTSTGEFVEWVTLPPIFTPTLEQVLTEGNTSDVGIILDAGLEALDVNTNTATINTNITIDGTITDGDAGVGASGNVLSSTVTGVKWVALPVYSATSPLLFNSATGVFSIQQATNSQSGYLSSSDWITFDGKQNAGNYITALTGEATASGPGSATVTLGNAAVIGKVLTGFNPIAGTINASDSILTAFGKTQSQINALVGGVLYKGTWNASANLPVLTSSVGVQGNYYVVNVAGNTNLNGITDWKIGDWAIFSESVWQKVDNTESVSSVNGFTGAVELTTDDIPEGTTNLYFLNSRARQALSFLPGSGAYDNTSGAITIPTDNNQILNGAGYITFGSLSASSPLVYNNLTGAFSIPKATSLVDGYLSAADWSTFNGKQNYLGGTGLVKSTAGTISYITDNSSNWNTAYDRSIISAAVTGTTTKTLTLNEQDGGTITASWTDLDTGLTSVGVSMPGAFTVTNSPLTSNGTIAITGAGTTLQYIDGTGALRTFPGLTGYVPYTGATQNVDLGEFGISAGYFQADLTPTGALQVGRMQWNNTDGTMDLRLLGNNVTLQIGQENVTRVVNKSGIDLLEANYQVVRVRKVAEGGAQGQRLAVVLAQGNNENNSTEVIGLVTETINSNQEGFVTAFGEVKNINTTGSLQGETWVDGDILYLSDTIPGQLTKVRPIAPNHAVIVGYVTYAHVNNGKIYMAIDTGYELGELHNVYAPSPTANQSIYWNVANSRYQLNTIGGILGYTPADAATTLTINGTTYDLSANRTWNVGTVTSVAALTLGTSGTDLSSSVATGTTTPVITLNVPTASAANRGALSAADWSTFNTKVGSVTASSPLASSGGSTPNITIQQASGSQDGYLSSTDWTTFNSKQAAGNYITSLTGEATASGPGAAAVTLNNASVTGKVLTGVNITGGTVQATDTMLTAFGKLQNQINGLIGSTIYQGTWNASTNTPALASGVGVRGYYYIVSVAGTTNLDGISDWFVGDWAIFDGTAWQQVDNTDAVVSVNGQTGAVSLTTDNIPEGATNQYYLNSRARAALSFTAGSGAYNSTTGVITIPTNTSQLTNGANFITLASLSGTAPIGYNNTTGAISITQAGTASNGFLSSTDWNTFNNKQGALTNPVTGTGNNNYIAKFSSTGSTIANSLLQSNTSGVFIEQEDVYIGADAQPNKRLGFVKKSGFIPFIGYASSAFTISSTAGTSIDASNTFITRFSMDLSGNATFSNFLGIGANPTNGKVEIQQGATPAALWVQTGGTTSSFVIADFRTGTNLSAFNILGNGTSVFNGNVGIGTNNPSGAAGLALVLNSGTSQGRICIKTSASGDASGDGLQIVMAGLDASIEQRENADLAFATNAVEKMRITSGGNVLIGSLTDNGSKLQVNGAGVFSSSVTATQGEFLSGGQEGATGSVVRISSTNPLTRNWGIVNTWDNYGDLTFRVSNAAGGNALTAGSTKMVILLNGNVGIGTSTPNAGLEVVTDSGAFNALRLVSNRAQNLGTDVAIGFRYLYDSTNYTTGALIVAGKDNTTSGSQNGNIQFYTNGGSGIVEHMRLTSGGFLKLPKSRILGDSDICYIDLYNPNTGNLSIVNTSANVNFGNIIFSNNAGEAMRINTSRNLLIQTTTGITGGGALQVNGNVNINGVFQINGVTIGGGGGSGVTGSGTTNYLSKWTGSTSLGNSIIQDNGTNASINGGILSYIKLYIADTGSLITGGNAVAGTNMKGVMIENTDNGDESIGLWFRTGNNHLSGISGQRNNSLAGWGTDLRFYTHENNTVNLTTTRERMRITSEGLVIIGYNPSNEAQRLFVTHTNTTAYNPNGYNGANGLMSMQTGNGTSAYSTIRFHGGGSNEGLFGTFQDSGGLANFIWQNFNGSNYGEIMRVVSTTRNLLIGTTTDAGYKLYVNGTVGSTGGFFDLSDKRLKTLITDNYQSKGIESVTPKLYLKNGKEELGYYAQDLQDILPSAVNEGVDGFLSLSYSQVHTAKIAIIEDEVTILKRRVAELEAKLN